MNDKSNNFKEFVKANPFLIGYVRDKKKSWQELYELYCKYPVKLIWVRGHVGDELNEMADEWANRARKGAKVPEV